LRIGRRLASGERQERVADHHVGPDVGAIVGLFGGELEYASAIDGLGARALIVPGR
jgi:hypothetical protein